MMVYWFGNVITLLVNNQFLIVTLISLYNLMLVFIIFKSFVILNIEYHYYLYQFINNAKLSYAHLFTIYLSNFVNLRL
jgi:hypothetical protein